MTARKHWFKVADSILWEDWSDTELAVLVRLQAYLNTRRARDDLSAAEAAEAVLDSSALRLIARLEKPKFATFRVRQALLKITASTACACLEPSLRHPCGCLSLSVRWPKFAIFQGYETVSRPGAGPSDSDSVAPSPGSGTSKKREEKRAPAAPAGGEPPASVSPGAQAPPGPEPEVARAKEPSIAEAWRLMVEAGMTYRPSASRWILDERRKKAIRQAMREHPDRGVEVGAQLVHGYRIARAAWDRIDDYFNPQTLLAGTHRAAYLEAFDESRAKGQRPATELDDYFDPAEFNRRLDEQIARQNAAKEPH